MTCSNGVTDGPIHSATSRIANGNPNGTANSTNGAVKNGLANGNAFLDGQVAISPNAPEQVSGLLKDILNRGLAFSGDCDVQARTSLLDAARSLVYALETPREAMIRYCWSQVCTP